MQESDSTEVSEAVRAAVAAGRKIDAIKLVREEQGLGLKEAKHLVERLEVPASSYSRVSGGAREESGATRLLVTLVVLGAIAAVYYLL